MSTRASKPKQDREPGVRALGARPEPSSPPRTSIVTPVIGDSVAFDRTLLRVLYREIVFLSNAQPDTPWIRELRLQADRIHAEDEAPS